LDDLKLLIQIHKLKIHSCLVIIELELIPHSISKRDFISFKKKLATIVDSFY